ncbi:pyridoxamine 5'-phosphate oxidase family protein [Streptomyces sp. APSN-46.1]|uniref:pyridoxamine 5'-phosphate oxidase family protein n=1 Tax=Streptomyces sp. APSN-46.1 TaxID=2929049 RepID=UPI001FB566C1|nr:pyridoxamine 5'-phosphate oxidase family protein [Streptomyces sp. APSN-46.1]MCJ1676400.1 pyridoxamine 5'-phosphate oxidase family protein [Streptomyces sp. APSN-46.1]
MPDTGPEAELDERYSDAHATATAWSAAAARLAEAEVYWLTTVRPDSRPHTTPLTGVWDDNALYFCTGEQERKAKNLAANPAVVLTTGCNRLREGYDLVVEGDAVRVAAENRLRPLAEAWEAKYGAEWHFDVRNGTFVNPGAGEALVFEVRPRTVFGFGKAPHSQTRWRFS